MKRFAALLCILTLMLPTHAFAAAQPTLTPCAVLSEDATTVTVTVSITNSSAVCGGSFDLIYDPDLVECKSLTAGEALSTATFLGNANFAANAVRVGWIAISELPADGVVTTAVFSLLPDTEVESLTFDVSAASAYNAGGNTLSVSTNSVNISIPTTPDPDGDTPPVQEDDEEDEDIYIPPVQEDDEDEDIYVPPLDEEDTDEDIYVPPLDEEDTDEDIFIPPSSETDETEDIYTPPAEEPEVEDQPTPEEDPEVFLLSFTDVPEGAYYHDAVLWAAENGITNGTGDGTTFSPDAFCTRAQIVTFLWRAAGCPSAASSEIPFSDVATTSYYSTAVLWAAENGITNGTGDGTTFSPDTLCTRAQIVTFLWRAAGCLSAASSEIPFSDVATTSYYSTAVLWAAENAITNGTGDGTVFSPDSNCTRGQVVTFLYRAVAQ